MSLLQSIADAKALVASLEALLPKPDTPWYENIPESGVLCYVNDNEACCILLEEAFHHSPFKRRVFKYSAGTGFKALSPYYTTMTEWKYAIPVDHNLRLPNGRIF